MNGGIHKIVWSDEVNNFILVREGKSTDLELTVNDIVKLFELLRKESPLSYGKLIRLASRLGT